MAVAADATTLVLATSTNPVRPGQPVTFIATVTPASPGMLAPTTGSVQFTIDGKPLVGPAPIVAGSALSPSVTSLTAGNHTVSAKYVDMSGDFLGSTGTLVGGEAIRAATATVLNASAASTIYGQPVTFTAAVTNLDTSNAVTGSVNFYDGATLLGSATVSGGRAAFTVSALGRTWSTR